jgi:hypothetical protein
VFVLPLSPLPQVLGGDERPAVPPKKVLTPPGKWWKRISLILLLSVLLGTSIIGAWTYLNLRKTATPSDWNDDLKEIRARIAQGRLSLKDGNFQSAADEFTAAKALESQHLGLLLTPAEAADLRQLLQQALLLADLLSEPLEDVARQMDGLENEAGILFARRFKRKAVVFYSEVRRDAAGRYHMDYRIGDGRNKAKLDLAALTLLRNLPLQEPQLLLFGARLSDMHRQLDGTWLISLEPLSGVLLTDAGAAAACCFGVMEEKKLNEVLRTQSEWVAQSP